MEEVVGRGRRERWREREGGKKEGEERRKRKRKPYLHIGIYRRNQVKIRTLGWALIHSYWCPLRTFRNLDLCKGKYHLKMKLKAETQVMLLQSGIAKDCQPTTKLREMHNSSTNPQKEETLPTL